MISPQSSVATQSEKVGHYRWVICALLFLATSINYIDRQILSLLKPMLDVKLGWTNAQFGEIMAAFQGAYAIGLLGFGWLIDRFGVKIGYAISIVAWSLSAMGHALVGSINGFWTARVCLGLGESGNFPSAIKAVAIWFPKVERAFATSIFNAGANVGAIVAPAVVPLLATAWGWHAPFIAAGIAGFLWLFLWIPLYDSPSRQKRVGAAELAFIRSGVSEEPQEAQDNQPVHWFSLLGSRKAWSFIVAKFITDPVWWFFLIWLPDYFKKTRGLDIKESWVHLVTIYAIVTVLSIGGGWITGYLTKRGWSTTRARKTGLFFFALCVVPIIFASHVGDWSAVMLIGLAGAAHQAWSANLFTTVSDMFPKHVVASVTGIGSMAGSLGGILFPIYAGKLLDKFTQAGNIAGGYQTLFLFCGVAYIIAFVLNHLLAPRFEQNSEA